MLAINASVSAQRRQLLAMIQRLHFGFIHNLEIREGEPVLRPAPRIVRNIKLGSEEGPRPKPNVPAGRLREQIRDLFARLDELKNCVVTLEVQYGLPFRLTVELPAEGVRES